MATRRWSSKQRRYVTVENTERQRKSDAILAAVQARGLQPQQNYRDDTYLRVGGGEWRVELPCRSKQNERPYLTGSVHANSFEELLATFTDDLLFARAGCARPRARGSGTTGWPAGHTARRRSRWPWKPSRHPATPRD
jgi:hypothetical protein